MRSTNTNCLPMVSYWARAWLVWGLLKEDQKSVRSEVPHCAGNCWLFVNGGLMPSSMPLHLGISLDFRLGGNLKEIQILPSLDQLQTRDGYDRYAVVWRQQSTRIPLHWSWFTGRSASWIKMVGCGRRYHLSEMVGRRCGYWEKSMRQSMKQ